MKFILIDPVTSIENPALLDLPRELDEIEIWRYDVTGFEYESPYDMLKIHTYSIAMSMVNSDLHWYDNKQLQLVKEFPHELKITSNLLPRIIRDFSSPSKLYIQHDRPDTRAHVVSTQPILMSSLLASYAGYMNLPVLDLKSIFFYEDVVYYGESAYNEGTEKIETNKLSELRNSLTLNPCIDHVQQTHRDNSITFANLITSRRLSSRVEMVGIDYKEYRNLETFSEGCA